MNPCMEDPALWVVVVKLGDHTSHSGILQSKDSIRAQADLALAIEPTFLG